ncbi:MAG: acireductone synthase [Planctomycetota bacterium]
MNARVILLDIEGTTSSIEYVYDVLFPYVRAALPGHLAEHWNDADIRSACAIIATEANNPSIAATQETLLAEVYRLMHTDVKSTGLKALQGLVSKAGYESGKLRAHFYADVSGALKKWTDAGIKCCVYSSGSIGAQQNFYRYANTEDLSHFISANFDTTTGPKRERASYEAIAAALNVTPGDIFFFSDVTQELDAAKVAGMQTILVVRPGNKPVDPNHGHRTIATFDEA